MTAAAAIALEALERGLVVPRLSRTATSSVPAAVASSRKHLEALLDEEEIDFKRWKSLLPRTVEDLQAAFHDPENDRSKTLQFVGTVIEAMRAKLDAEKAALRRDKRTRRRIVKSREPDMRESEDWALRLHDRMNEFARRRHDERVAFYYALLALRADHDPDAQGGPIIDTAEGLERFLTTIHPA